MKKREKEREKERKKKIKARRSTIVPKTTIV